MKKVHCAALLAALLLLLSPSFSRADGRHRYRVLDAAMTMLEEGNPFLLGYNRENGTDFRAAYPLGCPYFWGGRRTENILQPASPGQNSDYYSKEKTYLYGLDCAGFTRWALGRAGYTEHDSIANLLNRSKYKEDVLYRAAKTTAEKRVSELQVGDIVAIRHPSGGYHCAMFIGTLLDFGYDRKNLPAELVPYLHYPLVIHCTGSSDYYERYRLWLEETGQAGVEPPCGGVIVSLLDAPAEAAPSFTPDVPDLKKPCFDLDGYHLEILDLSAEKDQRWIRWRYTP